MFIVKKSYFLIISLELQSLRSLNVRCKWKVISNYDSSHRLVSYVYSTRNHLPEEFETPAGKNL